jgi:ABC-type transporter Mla subunit MlaD
VEGEFSRLKSQSPLVITLRSRYGLRYSKLSHMSEERIEKTKSAIDSAGHIPADKKAALSEALSKLKPALDQISETHPEHAESIARLVEVSAHEATRPEKRPEHLKRLSHELRQSVENFEASHPKLTAFVNEYSTILSALGI